MKIPEQLASGIKIEIEVLSEQSPVLISVVAEQKPSDINNPIRVYKESQVNIFDNPKDFGSNKKASIDFKKGKDILCNNLLFDCGKSNFNSTIKFSVHYSSPK